MAERTGTGPVKPPVIDLTARSSRPEADAEPEASPRVRPVWWLESANWPLLGSTALAGAILGTLLTYILASGLPLPSRPQALPPDLSGAVAAQASQLSQQQDALDALKASTTRTQVSLDATIAQLDSGLKDASAAIAALKAAIPPAQPAVDLAPIEAEIKTLRAEVDAIAAGAPGTDASSIAENLASLEAGVASLTTRLNGVDSTLTALRGDLDATRKTLDDHINSALPNEVGPALKLPLILSGLESAFANGRPFEAEIDTLGAVLPGFAIPPELKAAAPSGLSRPDVLMRTFEAAIPTMLAARPGANGDWVQAAGDWVKGILALRPAEEEQGSSPEAVVSRIEGSMGRRDYATAHQLVAQLPAAMQSAAAGVDADIALHAAADTLVSTLRAQALAAAETAK